MLNIRLVFEEILQVGGNVAVRPTGSSMYPVIVTGDKLRISPPVELHKGDIILFRSGDLMVCHRIIRILRKDGKISYQTRGDSYLSSDEAVSAERVVGKVTRIDRGVCSPARKILLLMNPVLRFGRLNAVLFSLLTHLPQGARRFIGRGPIRYLPVPRVGR
jgi:signal peptidase I